MLLGIAAAAQGGLPALVAALPALPWDLLCLKARCANPNPTPTPNPNPSPYQVLFKRCFGDPPTRAVLLALALLGGWSLTAG